MPKIIDNYILEDKIGAGQFGDVFKGYHQQTSQLVAIKAIRRESIKGKFYELLENEIKVLKTCDNPNIIKLYAIKKTANHFYLMLEYCNQGDMLAFVRKSGTLPEQKVIKFLCQILSAFQDLVKHKIMHRDFKLANILLNDGNIKIADFGFAKLLSNQDYTTTMLGSPLNMAPEVLGGNKYNSKADIWSIGACVWQMLFGKPPYVAGNMVDLLNMIKSRPLKFPSHPVINQTLKDVIKKMLVVDSKRRISWNQLFNHPINTFLASQLRKQVNLELVEDESLMLNTSKLYLKKNLVINNPGDLHQNEDVNRYLIDVLKQGKKKQQFVPKAGGSGTPSQKQTSPSPQNSRKPESSNTETLNQTKQSEKAESLGKNQSNLKQTFRSNVIKLMNFRNSYVFLAQVADEILTPSFLDPVQIDVNYEENEMIVFCLINKILTSIEWLLQSFASNKCLFDGIEDWALFKNSQQLYQLKEYIENQLNVFKVYSNGLSPKIKLGISNNKYTGELANKLKSNSIDDNTYKKPLLKYSKDILKKAINKMLSVKKTDAFLPTLKHIEFCLIGYDPEKKFSKQNHDFKQFYKQYDVLNAEQSLLRIEKLIKQVAEVKK